MLLKITDESLTGDILKSIEIKLKDEIIAALVNAGVEAYTQ